MAMPLQIALFLASVAVVIFVAFCVPAVIQMRKHGDRMAQSVAELKAEISLLVLDSRKVLYSVNELSTRAYEQCDDVEQVLQTVRGWTDRVDRVVEEVGTAVEPPILAAARNVQVFYKGITKFLEAFSNRNHH